MKRAITVDLITQTFTTDSMGQRIPAETRKTVFGNLSSISRQEWTSYMATGRQGLVPVYQVSMFMGNYDGEAFAEIDGERYSIYRVYTRDDETVELYLDKRLVNG
jgi:hypothetical protein